MDLIHVVIALIIITITINADAGYESEMSERKFIASYYYYRYWFSVGLATRFKSFFSREFIASFRILLHDINMVWVHRPNTGDLRRIATSRSSEALLLLQVSMRTTMHGTCTQTHHDLHHSADETSCLHPVIQICAKSGAGFSNARYLNASIGTCDWSEWSFWTKWIALAINLVNLQVYRQYPNWACAVSQDINFLMVGLWLCLG
jgi:hypothetical protein